MALAPLPITAGFQLHADRDGAAPGGEVLLMAYTCSTDLPILLSK
jgi:hypothetical protein